MPVVKKRGLMPTIIRTALSSVAMIAIAAVGPLAAAQAGNAANGAKLYTAQKCSVCHKIAGKGGPMGPDLSKVGGKRDAAWLKNYLTNPKSLDPKNKMPAVKLKGAEMDDLIAYLLSLK
jgi:mono/diheme cytochrome c family protein